MKFMTFNSSCSYAALANLLEYYGVETSDRDIALEIGLPYLFAREDGGYISGPMLQSAKWYNIYLNPRGFDFREGKVSKERVCEYLRGTERAMLGIRVGENSKHAVIYIGIDDGKLRFINNKKEQSPEPDEFAFTESELMDRLDDTVMVATLAKIAPKSVDTSECFRESCTVLHDLKRDINEFCSQEKSAVEMRAAMNTLFRAVLLDGITMSELIGENEIVNKLKTVQNQLMGAVKANTSARLDSLLDLTLLNSAIDDYTALISNINDIRNK